MQSSSIVSLIEEEEIILGLCNKVMGQMCKVQALYLSHCRRRDNILQPLAMPSCKWQWTTDSRRFSTMKQPCSLMEQDCNGNHLIMLLVQRPSHCQWSMPETSSNFYVPQFGNIYHLWILETSPTIASVSPTFSGVSISALFDCCFPFSFSHHSISVINKFISTLSGQKGRN